MDFLEILAQTPYSYPRTGGSTNNLNTFVACVRFLVCFCVSHSIVFLFFNLHRLAIRPSYYAQTFAAELRSCCGVWRLVLRPVPLKSLTPFKIKTFQKIVQFRCSTYFYICYIIPLQNNSCSLSNLINTNINNSRTNLSNQVQHPVSGVGAKTY